MLASMLGQTLPACAFESCGLLNIFGKPLGFEDLSANVCVCCSTRSVCSATSKTDERDNAEWHWCYRGRLGIIESIENMVQIESRARLLVQAGAARAKLCFLLSCTVFTQLFQHMMSEHLLPLPLLTIGIALRDLIYDLPADNDGWSSKAAPDAKSQNVEELGIRIRIGRERKHCVLGFEIC